MTAAYNKLLKHFSLVLACCTFLLIIAGGLVTSTDSGLSVPDWPLSYGKLMPPMVGGILYEHGHRMIASFVGFLTVILVVLVHRIEKRIWLRRLTLVALSAVILQGLLGGLTVLYLLPTWISVSHATLAQSFFCLVSGLALFQTRWWQTNEVPTVDEKAGKSLFTLGIVAVGAVYVQLILGAVMRHTGSGLSVPDFPLAYGQIVPSLTPEALQRYNSELIRGNIRLAADGAITSGQIAIHMAHRFWALITATFVLIYAYRLNRVSQTSHTLVAPSVALFILVPVQIALGGLAVLTHKAVDITTAHVASGALVLVTCVVSTLMVYRVTPHAKINPQRDLNFKEVIA